MNDLKTITVCILVLTGSAATADEYVVQTNSRDEIIHLIDPGTQAVVAEIGGLPINHGVAASPDGSILYVSSEATKTLDIVDVASRTVTDRLPLTGRPNNIDISPDGKKVYVAITGQAGQINVVDTGSLERVSSIENNGGVHNVYVTPDGKHIVAGSIGGKNMAVYDAETEERLWSLFDQGVRPIAFETSDDGSTSRAFVQLSGFHGFAVVDFKGRSEVGRIELPSIPEEQRDPGPFNNAPAHGIGISPDGKTLWHCSRMNGFVYVYSLPELEYLGGIQAGSHPDWITFSPDGRFAYAANANSNDVTVIGVDTLEKVATIDVGKSPKRNISFTLTE
jgi:YVTN family beta-propeller protein